MPILSQKEAPERPSFDVYAKLREEAGEDLWWVSKLCDYFGIASRTLRVQIKEKRVPRPSKVALDGSLSLALFTLEDALGVQEYYQRTGRTLKRTLDPKKPLSKQKWGEK